ncbi:hypothetical protein PIB30_089417 [Stylosanthes scabra]|uniref:Uncharacterized protein n=1 Tax=Stylosanthes scabra TaxID=79078 RepID=A0ABU6QTX3_9FABA|nr:hypothetical protein [Stylosanthes scabra]
MELILMPLMLRPCQQCGTLNETDSIRCKDIRIGVNFATLWWLVSFRSTATNPDISPIKGKPLFLLPRENDPSPLRFFRPASGPHATLTPTDKAMIDASSRGALMNKTSEEAWELIETVADANQHFNRRANSKGVYEVAPYDLIVLAKSLVDIAAMLKEIKEG